jgi:lantibiotic biosynthesis protein
VGAFDVISGLTGVGRYLLLRQEVPECRRALESLLRCLVYLSEEDAEGVPHWYTAPEFLADGFREAGHATGNVNLGLAHGLAGPLALLSVAAAQGVEVTGQPTAVDRIAGRLYRSRVNDRWGTNFPTAVIVGSPVTAPQPSRAAWCYGTPGVARALWLAGSATGRAAYRELAVDAMHAVFRRPVAARRIDSPTFCHGVAGLLHVTLRFANDTGLDTFATAVGECIQQLLSAYEPDTPLGYRNLEPSGNRIDQPGILDGAAGVALVLLAAATPAEPVWDAAFLLS